MFANLVPIRLARTRTHMRSLVPIALLGLLLASCATAPERLLADADPSDAVVRVPPTAYRPVVNGYTSQRPVGPAPWAERNRQVMPAPEKGGQ